jgi:hypothetical protein
MSEVAAYSELDSRRFGKRIFRARVDDVTAVEALDEVARRERVDMLISRCEVERSPVAHALEASGHRLMDTLVHYAGPADAFANAAWSHTVREAVKGDRARLAALAMDAFTGYDGHYHADPRLDPRLATEGYVEWSVSCLDADAHRIWIAVDDKAAMGFLVVRREGEAGNIVLNGVASQFRRRGVYDSLVKAAGRSLFAEGAREVRSSTHIGNLTPQRAWMRHRMLIAGALYTFHKWFT